MPRQLSESDEEISRRRVWHFSHFLRANTAATTIAKKATTRSVLAHRGRSLDMGWPGVVSRLKAWVLCGGGRPSASSSLLNDEPASRRRGVSHPSYRRSQTTHAFNLTRH